LAVKFVKEEVVLVIVRVDVIDVLVPYLRVPLDRFPIVIKADEIPDADKVVKGDIIPLLTLYLPGVYVDKPVIVKLFNSSTYNFPEKEEVPFKNTLYLEKV